jgi:hypothetical protein
MGKYHSSFWRGLWSETGRNTGKWISNGIFGAKGWATPKRIIVDSDDSEISEQKAGFASNTETFDEEGIFTPALDKNESFELVKNAEIQSNDSNEICASLDTLLIGAFQAFSDKQDVSIFLVKLRLGISKLKQLGEISIAENYEKELKRLNRKRFFRFLSLLFLITFLLLGLLIVLIATK